MEIKTLFKPDLKATQDYGANINNLYYKLAYSPKDEKIKELTSTIAVGRIPFVLRSCGIPSGTISLVPTSIPHMIGFGQEKTTASYKNMHDLSLEEMLAIPNMITDPDMIFRSNTLPNSSLILCRELETRSNPVVIAMKIELKDTLSSAAIVVSGYEKDRKSREFFSDLYSNGYCIYDGEQSEFFNDIKIGSGVRDHLPGPIPASAVTCTDPFDKSLSPEGISPSDNYKVLTKTEIVNRYKENNAVIIGVFIDVNSKGNSTLPIVTQNLSELGYHLIASNNIANNTETINILRSCNSIVCDRNNLDFFKSKSADLPHIKKIGITEDFMPPFVFKTKLPPLSEISNKKHTHRSQI